MCVCSYYVKFVRQKNYRLYQWVEILRLLIICLKQVSYILINFVVLTIFCPETDNDLLMISWVYINVYIKGSKLL